MARASTRSVALIVLVLFGLASAPVPVRAGGFHHGSKVVVRGGGLGLTPGFGLGTSSFGLTPGFGLGTSSLGVMPGFGVGASNLGVMPGFGVGASNLGVMPGFGVGTSSGGLAYGMASGVAPAGVFPAQAMNAGGGLVLSAGGYDTSALQEYQNYLAHRSGLGLGGGLGAAGGVGLAAEDIQLASNPEFQYLAASAGGAQELAGIGGYLRQFAGRPEFWQRAFNLTRFLALNNPWFNPNQNPLLWSFLRQLNTPGGGEAVPGPFNGAAGNGKLADAIEDLKKATETNTETLKGLITEVRSLRDGKPDTEPQPLLAEESLQVGDRIKDVGPAGKLTVSRDGKEVAVTTTGPLFQAGDIVQEDLGEGIFQIKRLDKRFVYNTARGAEAEGFKEVEGGVPIVPR